MPYVNTIYNTNFLEYASYVIKERAIPNLEDGLKPVQRRILHSLFEMDDGKFHKVANVVGHCMKYHPHGDASIYEALVVLSQKDLLIDKQGNFGNIFTGDESSAARYIECRLLPLAKELLYNPELTGYADSYDGRNREPVTFPAKMPLILVLGFEGIAVGMSTKTLPHNFVEVLEATAACIRGEKFELYPDFPTGGFIDVSGYEDGNGKVLVRARLDTSDPKRIIIRDLPFGCTTESLIESIENAARKGTIKIQSISDFTTENVEIEVRLARGTYAGEVVDALYAFTACEQSIPVNLLVIKDNKPVQMRVNEVIQYHARRLEEILKAELELEQRKLLDRLHMRTLERIFIEERIYKNIEQKKTSEAVVKAVMDGFIQFLKQVKRPVTEEDVERLLKIPIRRISLYDINLARKDMEEIAARLKEIAHHLKHLKEYALGFISRLVDKNKKAWGRKSRIVQFKQVAAREVAVRSLKLRYDPDSGYIGHSISSGKVILNVSEFDRVLIFRGSGIYSIMNAPERIFVDKNCLYCGYAEKDVLENITFSVIFREKKTNFAFVKRFKIGGYILEKTYQIIPDDCEILRLTTQTDVLIHLKYKPAPRLRTLEQIFKLKDFPVRGLKAQGLRLEAKAVESILLERKGTKGIMEEIEPEV
jgi:topoisomerase IV subunit A